MFDKKFEDRLAIWADFRKSLETSSDPIQDTIEFYKHTPLTSCAADPYTPSEWPDPWELLEENNYCPFVKILAICYTLQLTDCLSQATYEIHIKHNTEKAGTFYFLYVNDRVVGLTGDSHVHKNEVPKTFYSQHEHSVEPLQ